MEKPLDTPTSLMRTFVFFSVVVIHSIRCFMHCFMGYLALIIITQTLLTSCGSLSSQSSRSHALGGVGIPFREFPGYMVKIDVQADRWLEHVSGTCSGVHIGDGVILTAAHCLIHNLDKKPARTKWTPKLYNFDQITYLSRRKSGALMPRHLTSGEIVMAVYHHNIPNTPPDYHDIAMIFTKPKIPFGDAALLPDKDYTHQPRPVDVYGVGLSFTDLYHFPESHRYFSGQASIHVESKRNLEGSESQSHLSQFRRWLTRATTPLLPLIFFISASNHAPSTRSVKGVCVGDSGGPVVISHPQKDRVIGITSHMNVRYLLYQLKLKGFMDLVVQMQLEGCTPFFAATHLFKYLPWIKDVISHYRKIDHNLSLASSGTITLSSEQLNQLTTLTTQADVLQFLQFLQFRGLPLLPSKTDGS